MSSDDQPTPRQRLLAIVIGTIIIAWVVYFNFRLVSDIQQGAQTPAEVPTATPSE